MDILTGREECEISQLSSADWLVTAGEMSKLVLKAFLLTFVSVHGTLRAGAQILQIQTVNEYREMIVTGFSHPTRLFL